MKNTLILIFVALIAMSSCKDKEPEITSTLDISPEMKAYFVDYEAGTKWIYQDTLDTNNFDTIELTQIEPYNTNRKGVLEKGYILHYKARKSKDFKVSVGRGQNVNFYVNIYTNVTGSGAVTFENYNGEWADWLTYYDSIEINTEKYYQVIRSFANGGGYSLVHVSKNNGIVYFMFRDYTGGISKGGNYHLIKTIKP